MPRDMLPRPLTGNLSTQLNESDIVEAAAALEVRCRWYDSRGYTAPEQLAAAARRFKALADQIAPGWQA